MRFLSVACLFAFISPTFADDVKNQIKLPIVKVDPQPQPVIGALKLSSDVYYVVESDVPVMILSSPEGIVSIASETGPIKLRGKFIDGNGKVETRSYRSKFIYTVEPASSGAVELLIFAVGEPDAAKVKRVQLLVGDVKPIPPPVDPVKPILTEFQTKLKAAIATDKASSEHVETYAALFRNASKTTVNDETLATTAALLSELQSAVKLLGLPAGSLNATARVVADELNTVLSKPAPLDAAKRASISTLLTRIATDLLEASK